MIAAALGIGVDVSLETLLAEPPPDKWVVLDGAGGMRVNTLYENPETGASIALLEVPKGGGIPLRHRHASNQFMYCVRGAYAYLEPTEKVLHAGSFYMNPKGAFHGPTRALEDCLLIEIYDGAHYFELPGFHSAETVGRIAAEA